MAVLILRKPFDFEGKSITELDLDPTLGGLKAFEAALAEGKPEADALCTLLVDATGLPAGAVDLIRSSDLTRAKGAIAGGGDPLESSSAGGAGETAPP